MIRFVGIICVASLSLTGCGKSDGISGTASFYKGIAGARSAVPAPPPKETDRATYWRLTPNKITITITSIAFNSGTTKGQDSAVSCPITWERGGSSLSKILDCPFTAPSGTYTGITLQVANQVKVTISDATNNIYTKNSSVSKLSATGPAEEVTINACKTCPATGSAMFDVNFTSSVTVDASHPPSVSVVFDPIQWLSTFTGSAPFGDEPFSSTNTGFPLTPSLSTISKMAFYSNAGTLDSFQESSRVAPKLGIKVYYGSDTTPVRADIAFGTMAFGCPGTANVASSAWNASHKTSTPGTEGLDKFFGGGGYLGLNGGKLAWALPAEFDYALWRAVMTLPEATTIGASAVLTYACTSTVPDPVSGDTYSSGLPTFTPTGTINLTLVGK